MTMNLEMCAREKQIREQYRYCHEVRHCAAVSTLCQCISPTGLRKILRAIRLATDRPMTSAMRCNISRRTVAASIFPRSATAAAMA